MISQIRWTLLNNVSSGKKIGYFYEEIVCSRVFQAKCDKEKGDLQTEKEKLARKFLKFFKGKNLQGRPK